MRARAMLVGWGVIGLLASRSIQAQNIVSNPGFESGFTGWVTNQGLWFLPTGLGGFDPGGGTHSGTGKAITACGGAACIAADPSASGSWLYQDLPTVVGQSYALSFWLETTGTPASGTAQFRALFGNTVAADFPSLTGSSIYTQYFNTLSLIASSTTTRLEFLGRNAVSYVQIDDISVTANASPPPITTAPEPTSVALMGSGLFGILPITRRRARRRQAIG